MGRPPRPRDFAGRLPSASCPSLAAKRVSPHVLRHSTAMELLQRGVDQTVIALWLGHESIETTQTYIHADLRMKEKALSRLAAPKARPGRYRPHDNRLASSKRSDYAVPAAWPVRWFLPPIWPCGIIRRSALFCLCRYRHNGHWRRWRSDLALDDGDTCRLRRRAASSFTRS
jgi:hypothetical protein